MRTSPLFSFALLLIALLAFAPLAHAQGVYSSGYSSTVDTLYGSGPEPAELAKVQESHRCAEEPAGVYIYPGEVDVHFYISYLPEGEPEQVVIDVEYDENLQPGGYNYTYIPPAEGAYKFYLLYVAHSQKTKYFAIDCTAGVEANNTPTTEPEPAPVEPAPAMNETVEEPEPVAEAPANETNETAPVPPVSDDQAKAFNAISSAQHAIDSAGSAAPSTSNRKLQEAQSAYDEGNYAMAFSLATEAEQLAAEGAANAAAAPEVPAQAGPGGLDSGFILPLALVAILIAALFLFMRRRGESGTGHVEKKENEGSTGTRPSMTHHTLSETEPTAPAPPTESGEWRSAPSSAKKPPE